MLKHLISALTNTLLSNLFPHTRNEKLYLQGTRGQVELVQM